MKNNYQNRENTRGKRSSFSYLLGLVASSIVLSGCGGGGGSSNGGGSPPVTGSPPSVTADTQILVNAGDAVTLNATGTDPDGDSITYAWSQTKGAAATNTQGLNTNSANFNAPDTVDTLSFTVTATAAGQSDTAVVQVIVLEDVDTALFVDADFTGTSDGTISAPFTSLLNTLENAPSSVDIYIKTPTNGASYSLGKLSNNSIGVKGGTSLYGGYSSDWSRDKNTNRTPVKAVNLGLRYTDVNEKTTVSGLALTVTGDNGTTLFGIAAGIGSAEIVVENNTIVVEDYPNITPSSSQGSLFGVVLSSIDTMRVIGNDITVGKALTAINRATRTSGSGSNGGDGENASVGLNTNGGDGGSGNGRSWNGGNGGDAGNNSFETGENGEAGNGRSESPFVRGGRGGFAGSEAFGRDGNHGINGDNGVKGSFGSGGSGYGALTSGGFFVTSYGNNGGDGYSGAGGGGGGGGSGGSAGANGGAGGGGGEGGSAGSSGFGGQSGGASIGIQIINGTTNEVSNNNIESGDGGNGGIGGIGSSGGDGGSGGDGVDGFQGPANAKGGHGGNGGDGGDGGTGGTGGSGGGGPSFGIFIGRDTPATVSGNTITTGNGGNGGSAKQSFEDNSAGRGGWTVGIFDGDTSDNSTPTISNNTFMLGEAGTDGGPLTNKGTQADSNF